MALLLSMCGFTDLVGEKRSSTWPFRQGVSQDSALFPILFNIYVKPLREIIHQFGINIMLVISTL